MAADGIIGQRRAAGVRIDDLAKRNEAQLNERLETVTDTAYQAVALFQQRLHLFADRGAAEERRDKLAGTVRLIAAGKAAGMNTICAFSSFFAKVATDSAIPAAPQGC